MIRDLRPHRRAIGAVVVGLALLLSPTVVLVGSAGADAPATSIAGLAQGARGDAVRRVQEALVNQGIEVEGGVDGIFGAGTAQALRTFQEQQGLPVTGIVDDATALALGLATSPLLGLAQGARGDAVRVLQQKLIAAGISVQGGADGIFGAATTTALKQFQKAKGLARTGTVDAATAGALGSVTVPAASGGSGSTGGGTSGGGSSSASLVGLKIGSRGDAVKVLQRQLIAAGHPVVGGADGIFGVLTANALSAFQRASGLKATGSVDEATATALSAASGSGGSGSGGSGSGGGSTGATSPLLGLTIGARGDKVVLLQQTLVKAGVPVRGGVDGVFGVATKTALEAYQRAVGLPASGTVDEATASALASGRPVPAAGSGGSGSGSGSASPSTVVGLRSGTTGAAVKELQQALIKAGVALRGGADGIFGPATAAALKTFQSSQGLPATGVVDEATAKALADPKPVAGGGSGGSGGGGASTSTTGFAQYGERGARVIALQQALVKAGFAPRGGVDGDFGSGTSAAVMDFQRAKSLPVTGKVDTATASKLGLAPMDQPKAADPSSVSFSVFPVQGRCYFADTWLAPRSGGRTHLGVDLIAAQGKLIYAVAGGTITKIYRDYPGSLSGNGVRLTLDDGTYFFYAHMTKVADGITVGAKVKAGQTIGYVGSTGSSATNHLHFEVHPKGGAAVNPYPLVKAIDACAVTAPRS